MMYKFQIIVGFRISTFLYGFWAIESWQDVEVCVIIGKADIPSGL